MDIDVIKATIESNAKFAKEDYERNLNKFGERDSLTNYYKGRLDVLEGLLKMYKK